MSRPSDYTLGEFRKLTKSLPDSTPIARYVYDKEYGSEEWKTPADVGLWDAVRCRYFGDFRHATPNTPPEEIVEIILI